MLENPRFLNVTEYGARFTDAGFWRPYVQSVYERHSLGGAGKIRGGLPGTHPVFIVEDQWVVKFFTRFFHGEESFLREREIYRLLRSCPSIPAPALLAEGRLFPGEEWEWPYLVSSFLPGESYGEARDRVPFTDRIALARFLGGIVRQIHRLPLGASSVLPNSWEPFLGFLRRQREAYLQGHSPQSSLPDHLLRQVEAYLPPVEELIDPSSIPLLLHCDFNEDHVLGRFEQGHWTPTGIIDFGDAKVGDNAYEWVALHLGLFHGDKRLLRAFLDTHGEESLTADFPYNAMCYTLLHEFDVLEPLFREFPALAQSPSLEDLARALWDVEQPGLHVP